ncbi:MAG TPA: type IV toxin-antitoxin system AbiEi family antitoxin [Steroidobacteraceae bacterium]|nr:type IV toxin-antitoxin system AbiEi family antitoxin [Steroidobacteraceae bacterium]
MESNLRTLGPLEASVVLSLSARGQQTVNTADLVAITGSGRAANNVARQLVRKGWLTRVIRGRYVLLPPEHGPENLGENNALALAGTAVTPSYIGWWSAAAHHGFTTQVPMTVFVATRRRLLPREIEGTPVRFIPLSAAEFFGEQPYDVYGRRVLVSSPAKTLIDCLDRPALTGGATEVARIAERALAGMSADEAVDVALRFRSKSVMQRLGAIAELVGRPLSAPARARLREAIPKSARSRFGRGKPRAGDVGYVAEWGLFVDSTREALLAELPRAKPHADDK